MGIHDELIEAYGKIAEAAEQEAKAAEMLAAHAERQAAAKIAEVTEQRRKDEARRKIGNAVTRIEPVDRLLGDLSLDDIASDTAQDPISMRQLREAELPPE